MSRKLEVQIKKSSRRSTAAWLEYGIRIVEQSHRGHEFTPHSNLFVASNGFKLISNLKPQLTYIPSGPSGTHYADTYYVRGHMRGYDKWRSYVSSPLWIEKLKVAVKEYNEIYG